jgi:hypothetical protein
VTSHVTSRAAHAIQTRCGKRDSVTGRLHNSLRSSLSQLQKRDVQFRYLHILVHCTLMKYQSL